MPTIQISQSLYQHIKQHRMKLIIAHNTVISFGDALDDMITKLQNGKIEKQKPKPEYKTYKKPKRKK